MEGGRNVGGEPPGSGAGKERQRAGHDPEALKEQSLARLRGPTWGLGAAMVSASTPSSVYHFCYMPSLWYRQLPQSWHDRGLEPSPASNLLAHAVSTTRPNRSKRSPPLSQTCCPLPYSVISIQTGHM